MAPYGRHRFAAEAVVSRGQPTEGRAPFLGGDEEVATVAMDVESYRDYVTARMDGLRRTAYLLCGDWHTADDLVSTTLVKLYRHWRRVSIMDNRDAYARRVLLRVWLDERRRPWRREQSTSVMPDHI